MQIHCTEAKYDAYSVFAFRSKW